MNLTGIDRRVEENRRAHKPLHLSNQLGLSYASPSLEHNVEAHFAFYEPINQLSNNNIDRDSPELRTLYRNVGVLKEECLPKTRGNTLE